MEQKMGGGGLKERSASPPLYTIALRLKRVNLFGEVSRKRRICTADA